MAWIFAPWDRPEVEQKMDLLTPLAQGFHGITKSKRPNSSQRYVPAYL